MDPIERIALTKNGSVSHNISVLRDNVSINQIKTHSRVSYYERLTKQTANWVDRCGFWKAVPDNQTVYLLILQERCEKCVNTDLCENVVSISPR